jgi:hypothetical protein
VLVDKGCKVYDTTAEFAYYGGQPLTMFVYNTNVAAGEDVLFERCVARLATLEPLGLGFYGHQNEGGKFGTITLRDCSADKCNAAVSFTDCALAQVDGLDASGCASVIFVDSADLDVDEYDLGGLVFATTGSQAPVIRIEWPTPMRLHDCDLEVDQASAGVLEVLAGVALTVEDCVFRTTDGGANPIAVRCTSAANGAVITLQRNEYNGFGYVYYLDGTITLASDYNTFDAGDFWHLNALFATTFAAWQAAGYDAHSTAE